MVWYKYVTWIYEIKHMHLIWVLFQSMSIHFYLIGNVLMDNMFTRTTISN